MLLSIGKRIFVISSADSEWIFFRPSWKKTKKNFGFRDFVKSVLSERPQYKRSNYAKFKFYRGYWFRDLVMSQWVVYFVLNLSSHNKCSFITLFHISVRLNNSNFSKVSSSSTTIQLIVKYRVGLTLGNDRVPAIFIYNTSFLYKVYRTINTKVYIVIYFGRFKTLLWEHWAARVDTK